MTKYSNQKRINEGHLELSEVEDPRILTQLLLDFVDGFTKPIISQSVLSEVQAFTEKQEKFRDFLESDRVASFNTSEFCVVERLVKFFAKIRKIDGVTDEMVLKASTRLSISLLLFRKKLDSMFFQRSLVSSTPKDLALDAVVKFLISWINDYQKKDVLILNEKKGQVRINHDKLNSLLNFSPVLPQAKNALHHGIKLPKIEQTKTAVEEESKLESNLNPKRANSIDNTSKKRTLTKSKNESSPFDFLKIPGSNLEISTRLKKRQEVLDEKITNDQARSHLEGLVENFAEMNSSLQELVIEQLKEINNISCLKTNRDPS